MKRRSFLACLIVITVLARTEWLVAAPLDELVAAARKEGTLDLYAPSSLTPLGAQALGEGFNKKYNLQIKVNYNPGSSFTRDVGKVVGLAATGVPPEWDLMLVHDSGHAALGLRKLQIPYDYKSLGIDPRAIHYDSGTIAFANMIVLPAYNKKVLPPQDVPKKWEDLLDPKWEGGKLGMSTATHHLARLAAGPWGEERTTRYVKGLAQQGLSLGTLGEVISRLQLGETLVAITMIDGFIHQAKLRGAPIAHAEGIEPLISPAFHSGVVKGARRPNAGHLFSVFLTTPKAQEIWAKYGGERSAFLRGTRAYTYAQGKQGRYMSDKDGEILD